MDVIFPPFLSQCFLFSSLVRNLCDVLRLAFRMANKSNQISNYEKHYSWSYSLSLLKQYKFCFAFYIHNNLISLCGAWEWKAKNLSGKQFYDILRFIFWLMRFYVFIWVHSLSLFVYLMCKSEKTFKQIKSQNWRINFVFIKSFEKFSWSRWRELFFWFYKSFRFNEKLFVCCLLGAKKLFRRKYLSFLNVFQAFVIKSFFIFLWKFI